MSSPCSSWWSLLDVPLSLGLWLDGSIMKRKSFTFFEFLLLWLRMDGSK